MAKKKTIESGGPVVPKTKSLFDHINEIRVGKRENYFTTLSDADKKTWSNYMVSRFLSMQPDLIEVINDIQYYQNKLGPEHFYRLCIAVVPKGRGFYPYIKNTSETYSKQLLELLREHFKESEENVVEYLGSMESSELRKIISMYGFSEDDIEGMMST